MDQNVSHTLGPKFGLRGCGGTPGCLPGFLASHFTTCQPMSLRLDTCAIIDYIITSIAAFFPHSCVTPTVRFPPLQGGLRCSGKRLSGVRRCIAFHTALGDTSPSYCQYCSAPSFIKGQNRHFAVVNVHLLLRLGTCLKPNARSASAQL